MASLRSWIGGVLFCATAMVAQTWVPTVYSAARNQIRLESMVPSELGSWRLDNNAAQVVQSPDMLAQVERVYSQSLMRVYRGPDGARVMLSIAYTTDQRGNRGHQVHQPEICYPAQGFALSQRMHRSIRVGPAVIPVTQMVATLGMRTEPLMYWITLDGKPENNSIQLKLDQVSASLLRGEILDGLIFRVSVLDPDPTHAYRVENAFLNAMYDALDAHARQAFFGSVPASRRV